ncbi:hypothetical protein [Methylobacterium organophilum]|uniref:Transposase n=1 Tax=Methylobacterium organophilum TaxID=410 RepID=A0ABQ4TCS6_METOR|nr:hypothetical protein [Methylobacterium organophilum]UMY18568.1 hypothetical protein MMB17_04355 [Methylobacterium organophilum]GJE29487.1 hypothetical protein LKMONMHP_4368 [Methylobacterium organophilum]
MPSDERKTRFGSFLEGLGALASIWPAPEAPLRYPHRDEAEALRLDGLRIGNDMRRVIVRERLRAETPAV